jgi:putative nucleotidyltransferase with HDIG domain
MSSAQFTSVNLGDVLAGEPLPVVVYIYLNFRFITFRAAGDTVDRSTYDRLEYKGVKNLFVKDLESKAFMDWVQKRRDEIKAIPALPPANKGFQKAREDMHRKAMDIFSGQNTDKNVVQSLSTSKKLVAEVMKFPYAMKSLAQLQGYSQGTVDHSVNVSILSIYLAMQMGYSHQVILQYVGTGGLLHDIGKPKVKVVDADSEREIDTKMKEHAAAGAKIIESIPKVPNEVKMIVAQHHEYHDGSGFPKKLRGKAIYDLARIVCIANVFDELVGEGQGSLVDRQRAAIQQMDRILFKKFDPEKLTKAVKILKLGV